MTKAKMEQGVFGAWKLVTIQAKAIKLKDAILNKRLNKYLLFKNFQRFKEYSLLKKCRVRKVRRLKMKVANGFHKSMLLKHTINSWRRFTLLNTKTRNLIADKFFKTKLKRRFLTLLYIHKCKRSIINESIQL